MGARTQRFFTIVADMAHQSRAHALLSTSDPSCVPLIVGSSRRLLELVFGLKDASFSVAAQSDVASGSLEVARRQLLVPFPDLDTGINPFAYYDTSKVVEALFCLSLFGSVFFTELCRQVGSGRIAEGELVRYAQFYREKVFPLTESLAAQPNGSREFYQQVAACEQEAYKEFTSLIRSAREGILGLRQNAPVLVPYESSSSISWRDRVFA